MALHEDLEPIHKWHYKGKYPVSTSKKVKVTISEEKLRLFEAYAHFRNKPVADLIEEAVFSWSIACGSGRSNLPSVQIRIEKGVIRDAEWAAENVGVTLARGIGEALEQFLSTVSFNLGNIEENSTEDIVEGPVETTDEPESRPRATLRCLYCQVPPYEWKPRGSKSAYCPKCQRRDYDVKDNWACASCGEWFIPSERRNELCMGCFEEATKEEV